MTGRAIPKIIGHRDLYIDGVCHQVTDEVLGHVHFLSDLVCRFAYRIDVAEGELKLLREAQKTPSVRWTPGIKEAIAIRAAASPAARDAILLAFEISDEELDSWITRYGRYGIEGLKSTKAQVLARGGEA